MPIVCASEIISLKVSDIGSADGHPRVEQGKDRKDRYVMLFDISSDGIVTET